MATEFDVSFTDANSFSVQYDHDAFSVAFEPASFDVSFEEPSFSVTFSAMGAQGSQGATISDIEVVRDPMDTDDTDGITYNVTFTLDTAGVETEITRQFTAPRGSQGEQGFQGLNITGVSVDEDPADTDDTDGQDYILTLNLADPANMNAASTVMTMPFTVPRGPQGPQGDQAMFGDPTVTTVAAGGTPTAAITGAGTPADPYILDFGLVTGDTGAAGASVWPVFASDAAGAGAQFTPQAGHDFVAFAVAVTQPDLTDAATVAALNFVDYIGDDGITYSDAQARTAVDFDVTRTDNVVTIQGIPDGETTTRSLSFNLGTVAQSLTVIDVNISPIEDDGGTTVAVASTRAGGTGRTTLVLDRIPTRLPNRGSTITDQATAGGNEWNVHFAVRYTDLDGVEHAEITIDNPPATPALGTNLFFDANQSHPVTSLIAGNGVSFDLDAQGDLTINATGETHHPHADIRIRANPNEVVTPIAADTNVTITVSGVGEEGATVTNLAITEITATGGLGITGTGLTRTLTVPAGHTNNVVVTAMVTYTFDDGSGNDEMVGPIAETVTVVLDAAWAFGFNAGVPTAFSDLNAQGPFRSPERVTNLTQPTGEDFYFALPTGTGTPSVQDGALFLEVLQVTGFTGYDVYEVAEVTTGSNIVIEV